MENHDDRDAKVLEAYHRLQNGAAVGRELGIVRSTVWTVLRRHHIGLSPTAPHSNTRHHFSNEEAMQRYEAGESSIDLGRAYGVDPEVVRKRLRARGVKMRRRGAGTDGPQSYFWKGGRAKVPREKNHRLIARVVARLCLLRPLK